MSKMRSSPRATISHLQTQVETLEAENERLRQSLTIADKANEDLRKRVYDLEGKLLQTVRGRVKVERHG